MSLTFTALRESFERDLKSAPEDTAYVILVQMEGFPENEKIVNPKANIKAKLEYWSKTYDENLNHRFSPGIKIVGYYEQ